MDPPFSDLDIPIAHCKGKNSTTAHPISHFVSYDRLRPSFCSFALSIYSESTHRNYKEAFLIPHLKKAMDEEIQALLTRGIWDLVSRPDGTNIVSCRWVYTIKYKPDGSVDRYKARMVARGYMQTFGVDYVETFSPMA